MEKLKNTSLINADTGHFRILDFININLNIPILWRPEDYSNNENNGANFLAYEQEGDEELNIGYIMIADTTKDETELDVGVMNDTELKNYNNFLENAYRDGWGEQFVSWTNYEISKTKQGNVSFITKCVIDEYSAGKKFDYSMRTSFNNRTIYVSAAVREENLFFMKYYKSFKSIIDNITFETIET